MQKGVYSEITGDLFAQNVDAIVIPANPEPIIGSGNGIDRDAYMLAGSEQMLRARQQIGNIIFGHAAATRGYRLKARTVIHTATPVYRSEDWLNTLYRCYRSSIYCARKWNCRSVAFPLLGTGVMKIPKEVSLKAARDVLNSERMQLGFDRILLVQYSADYTRIPEDILADLMERSHYEYIRNFGHLAAMFESMEQDKTEYARYQGELELLAAQNESFRKDQYAHDLFCKLVSDYLNQSKGHSQTKLAEAAGLHKSMITRYLNGEQIPPRDSLLRICMVLHTGYPEMMKLFTAHGYYFPGSSLEYEYKEALLADDTERISELFETACNKHDTKYER